MRSPLARRECESNDRLRLGLTRELHLSPWVKRLRFAHELKAHDGCVNRLCWNDDGSLLASASDDCNVAIWRHADSAHGRRNLREAVVVPTQHVANIFGVKFLPCSGDRRIVTGSMDCTCELIQVDEFSSRGASSSSTTIAGHTDRVKGVEVEPLNPHNFWSASEDGTVRQHDTRCLGDRGGKILITAREDDTCMTRPNHRTIVPVEVKSVAINKVAPHQIALACGDPFVRVYDRRKLSLSHNIAASRPLIKLTAPHLLLQGTRAAKFEGTHTTCVSFGATGRRVVATWHSDHCYAFDVAGDGAFHAQYRADASCVSGAIQGSPARGGGTRGGGASETTTRRRDQGVAAMRASAFSEAIACFTEAIELEAPWDVSLLKLRAEAFLARDWNGDAAFALRDCEDAIAMDALETSRPPLGEAPLDNQAYGIRLLQIESLHRLKQIEAAGVLLGRVERQLPSTGGSHPCARLQALKEDVSTALEMRDAMGKPPEFVEEGSAPKRGRSALRNFELSSGEGSSEDPSEDSDEDSHEHRGLGFDGHNKRDDARVLESIKATSLSGLWKEHAGPDILHQRYVGHSNCQTDTKEVTFLGSDDGIVAAGSDCGNVFLYDADKGTLLACLHDADSDIANCVQCHPHEPILATSGLESTVKLWAPSGEAVEDDEEELARIVEENQKRQNGHFVRPFFPSLPTLLGSNPEILSALANRLGLRVDDVQDAAENDNLRCHLS